MGIDSDILTTKSSNFNANLFVHECRVCGKPAIKDPTPLDTHHIKEQQTSNY